MEKISTREIVDSFLLYVIARKVLSIDEINSSLNSISQILTHNIPDKTARSDIDKIINDIRSLILTGDENGIKKEEVQ